MMQQVDVSLANERYPIWIGRGLLGDAAWLKAAITHTQIFILTDEHVAPHWLQLLRHALAGRELHCHIVSPGESAKSLNNFSTIMDRLIEAGMRRNGALIALGGGVIGDLGGFVGACYQRGIDVIQIPTTLLAQVDSSVGGKTAINHAAGKNLIGAFHQPRLVVSDTDTLNTLPERERLSGFAEIIKYGVIADGDFLCWMEQHAEALRSSDATAMAYAIARSCQIKADVVASDPLEHGRRAILNYGHTFAHAIETELGYGNWLHGEAVGLGMLQAARLAARIGMLQDQELPSRLQHLLLAFSLPTTLPQDVDRAALCAHMRLDKKNTSTRIRFVLPVYTGRVELRDDVAPADVMAILA